MGRSKTEAVAVYKVAWKDYREMILKARDKVREAKTHFKLNLSRNIKDRQARFARSLTSKRILVLICARKREMWLPWAK